jgi:hypothetical protein
MRYSEIPPFVTVSKAGNLFHYTVNYLVEQVDEEYEVGSVTIAIDHNLCDDDYGPLVSAIIHDRYSPDDIEAIHLNYTASKTTEHKNEFAALNQWRATAKEKAREAIGYVAGLNAE